MHLLNTSTATLDEQTEPVDLRQPPAPMAVLSFTDSDLAGLAAAWEAERDILPALRLVPLRELRHPMSVDLWLDRTAAGARIIVLRLLGGLDWWRYGAEQLAAFCRARGIALAVLPGEDRADDRLPALSTLPAKECAALLEGFRAGGVAALRGVLRRMAGHCGVALDAPPAQALPPAGLCAEWPVPDGTRPVVPIIFYRSMRLAEDMAPVTALAEALVAQGAAPVPIFVASLKEPHSVTFLRDALPRLGPALIVSCTAFAEGQAQPVLAACGAPVIQAVIATTARAAWTGGARGLGAADLAMHVVLPELDGRVLGGAIGFKDAAPSAPELGFTRQINRAEPDRVAQLAARVMALLRLRATPPAQRRLAVLLPDYPGAGGRTGYAVGLDVPASVLALLADLRAAGYDTGTPPASPRALLDALAEPSATWPLADYAAPPDEAWGAPEHDPDATDGAFRFRALECGNILLAVAPDRGRAADRRATYHDPALPPRHALRAFGLWLRRARDVHAVIHMGAHGTLEWLPGKAVALTSECYPERVLGALPVVYPFLVSNPGEAAQAKRRIAAVTLGHLPPPLTTPALAPELHDLDRLLDEFAAADGMDRRRRERLAQLIQEKAAAVPTLPALPDDADERLRALDAWMCDVKELALQDGLHIYGRAAPGAGAEQEACAEAERAGLLAALDASHIPPGPAGAPARGRRDVMPTGRNLATTDPRGLPTPTAMELGRLAAAEALRLYAQEHGEMPRRLVLDLWGSATLRTGGEEVAQGLALLGCTPVWEAATGRVTGIEVQPPAVLGRARVDVTWRISGLFRDLFPAQIALLDAAVRAVAARDESAEENPLAAARVAGEPLARIFGTAPGAYGAGVEDALSSGDWTAREELGRAYLAAASHRYGGPGGDAVPDAGFATRVALADALLHTGDDPARDLLQGGADVAHLGGFVAAAASLGATPALITLDTTNPARPRARGLEDALRRLVLGRAVDPRFIAGQMRHGPRGASELAETVDRLVAFAETTQAVDSVLLDRIHAAYVRDATVRDFLRRENPAAARAIALRLSDALRRGLWHPRRNSTSAELALLTEPT
ncbi:cobaltochelatase subunit CobN [Roseococcus suduntuyensis]|uniref:Cobaltochelatase CobN n=1 Tax=Roseococcus suduntuyensis TaxID=455361 RepID=A0A840AHW1_9PROT|nr:cobaltochelatase subunit CobN [Roseococcus suduntuyensis]MBB3899744.1 cobaltochelatase CobN [Roseococcus suduntuyensis]